MYPKDRTQLEKDQCTDTKAHTVRVKIRFRTSGCVHCVRLKEMNLQEKGRSGSGERVIFA